MAPSSDQQERLVFNCQGQLVHPCLAPFLFLHLPMDLAGSTQSRFLLLPWKEIQIGSLGKKALEQSGPRAAHPGSGKKPASCPLGCQSWAVNLTFQLLQRKDFLPINWLGL